VDPRSITLHHLPHVLETPSLIDVSECASLDDIRGEAAVELHDDSTDTVQCDRTESVSDASQYVTEGGVVRSSLQPDIPTVSPISTPLLDANSNEESSIPSTTSFSLESTLTELEYEPVVRPESLVSSSGVHVQKSDFQIGKSSSTTTTRYTCPHCPRSSSIRAKVQSVFIFLV
jgi:hypothetical protein